MKCPKIQLQINGLTESDVKEVIKKQLEHAPKRKGGKKNAYNEERINTTKLVKIWNYIGEITFLRLNIRSSLIHFQLGSSA